MTNLISPRRQMLARVIFSLLEKLKERGISTKNLIVGGGSGFNHITSEYEKEVKEIANAVLVTKFNFSHSDLILLRTVNNDSRHGLTDRYHDASRILEICLPRFKDKGTDAVGQSYAEPLKGEHILTWDQITELFVNEPVAYIRKRITQLCIDENTSILPLPEDNETSDLEFADGEWLINQGSTEGIALQAVLNYLPSDLRKTDIPRFQYISRALAPLREITELTPVSKTPTMKFITGGANALFSYMRIVREDETDIEAIDLFGSFQNFRGSIGSHRETALSVQVRLNNGKPAYRDLLNLARRYRGLHYWGLETLARQVVPLMKPMYESEASREETVNWLLSCGVLEAYQKHKRFYVKND